MTSPDPSVPAAPRPAGTEAPPELYLLARLHVEPIAKGRPRTNNGATYTPPRTRRAEADVRLLLKAAMKGGKPYTRRLSVSLHFDCPTRRRVDIDNLAKLVLDAANGVVFVDDSQIDELRVTRRMGVKPPLTVLEVSQWPEVAA